MSDPSYFCRYKPICQNNNMTDKTPNNLLTVACCPGKVWVPTQDTPRVHCHCPYSSELILWLQRCQCNIKQVDLMLRLLVYNGHSTITIKVIPLMQYYTMFMPGVPLNDTQGTYKGPVKPNYRDLTVRYLS